uniref:Uncharacterized protein n=1 Tax=Ailuropoda melanoleuca TaxID=9646 RepID=A0A7N5P5K9_AILME
MKRLGRWQRLYLSSSPGCSSSSWRHCEEGLPGYPVLKHQTMTTSHPKQSTQGPQQLDFLKDLVASVPDMQGDWEDNHMERDKGPHRGWKPGSRGWKNGRMGSKGKEKKLSGMDLEQKMSLEDTEADREEETPQLPPQASHPLPTLSPLTPLLSFTLSLPLPPAPPFPSPLST